MTLWEGRLESSPDPAMLAYTVSIGFDVRLAPDDIAGTRAHVKGLVKAALITAEEAALIGTALDRVEHELSKGTFTFLPTDEDIHTAIERRVTELARDAGAKVHTGRSRNDQVATALRLFTRRALTEVAEKTMQLQRVLLYRAEAAGDAYLPGYTHMQRAQPVPLAHHLLAHGWALARDVDRLLDARRRTDVSPLGAGALAGSSLPLDPDLTADELGFASRFENSLDAVSDRDFVAESLFALTLLGTHLSRIGEELVFWSSSEFGFCHLDDSWSTGSSMLPQKKNPDLAELARGRSGRIIGHLAGFLATLKGLPLAYNRDLQEDKEPLFDAIDQLAGGLDVLAGALETIHFDVDRMKEAADHPGAAATDLAEWLVERGHAFRQAHGIVGALVRDAVERGVPLEDLVAAHPDLGNEATALLSPGAAVSRRQTAGGAGQAAVAEQMERFRTRIAADSDRI